MQLAQTNAQTMSDHERKYKNPQGLTLENELAKIIIRYQNEGRPDSLAYLSEGKKQVRFGDNRI